MNPNRCIPLIIIPSNPLASSDFRLERDPRTQLQKIGNQQPMSREFHNGEAVKRRNFEFHNNEATEQRVRRTTASRMIPFPSARDTSGTLPRTVRIQARPPPYPRPGGGRRTPRSRRQALSRLATPLFRCSVVVQSRVTPAPRRCRSACHASRSSPCQCHGPSPG